MKEKKKILLTILVLIVLILGIVWIIKKVKDNQNTKTSFEGNTATSQVVLADIEFTDITKVYENGVTTIKANVYNHTNQTKDLNVEIILKDEEGNEIKRMIQAIEGIEPNRKKLLQTGITGDYTKVTNIELKELSEEEIRKINER